MRLFLVRHGETVDNVAGLYAGSRDSALTVHGVLQAQRLASHLADAVYATHIFSSNLQRAVMTAEAVCAAQACIRPPTEVLSVVQLPELREKHFGSGEGVKYGAAARTEEKKEHVGAETVEQMRARVSRFLDDHLTPLLADPGPASMGVTPCVIVVAHGIILSVLFKTLCARFLSGAIVLSSEAQGASLASSSPVPVLSPAWSNTGYLEATILDTVSGQETSCARLPANLWLAKRLLVEQVNCVIHLKGLKKTRGGIGSARFDEKQRTMDSFFGIASKKRKLDDAK
ncbi:putative phosphatase [Paramyrothecium foliicola]|nr:putative phosphatase [Paramyrothecium foliicola]